MLIADDLDNLLDILPDFVKKPLNEQNNTSKKLKNINNITKININPNKKDRLEDIDQANSQERFKERYSFKGC